MWGIPVGSIGDTFGGLGWLGILIIFWPLPLDVVVDQTECNVVVDGVVELTEFCRLGGPKAGKSSFNGLEVVVVVVVVAVEIVPFVMCDIGTATFLVWDSAGRFPAVGATFGVVLGVTVVVVVVVVDDDEDDTTKGDIALSEFGSVDVSSGASDDVLEKKLRIPPKKLDFLVVGGGGSVVTVDLINFCPKSALA